MDDQQQFCLRWNDFQTNMVASFKHLRNVVITCVEFLDFFFFFSGVFIILSLAGAFFFSNLYIFCVCNDYKEMYPMVCYHKSGFVKTTNTARINTGVFWKAGSILTIE